MRTRGLQTCGTLTMLSLVLWLASGAALAASQPTVTAKVEGVEVCAQGDCDGALFIGTAAGQVGTAQTRGGFGVVVTHGPLPEPGQTGSITGGQWALTANQTLFTGTILGGSLVSNGNQTFTVTATLLLLGGGLGTLTFQGVLDHNTLPPILAGIIVP